MKSLKLPEVCPNCGKTFGAEAGSYLMIRTELDFDSDDESRIEDQVFECSQCHTLFRARYELIEFVQLEEKKP